MYSLGIDVGSVSTDIVLMDENNDVKENLYIKTKGKPILAVQSGLKAIKDKYGDIFIEAVGTTGSGRSITGFLVGADIIKNEITTHAVAAIKLYNSISTIIEIGGQDSKIIIIRNGIVTDFAMNTVCAAGTGSFLDRQAERLEIPIEEFGEYAVRSKTNVRIAGRCAVFAESDMIHKQQMGYSNEDIIGGLCEALVRNYLNNVAKGKEIKDNILFQGGVAANIGIKAAFERLLQKEIIVPKYYNMMGAIGAAVLALEKVKKTGRTNFKGLQILKSNYNAINFNCEGCSNECEIIKLDENNNALAYFGDRCGKYSNKMVI